MCHFLEFAQELLLTAQLMLSVPYKSIGFDPLKVILTELIVKVDTSGNSSFAELLWRSIITEFADTSDTKEVTLLEATVLVNVLTSMPSTVSVMFHVRKVSVVEQVSVSLVVTASQHLSVTIESHD